MNRLPQAIANSIFDILVAEADALESDRTSFLYTFSRDPEHGRNYEFRIGGKFGFAGKFWWNNDRFYVSGHSRSDRFPEKILEQERVEADRINALLAPLYEKFEQYRLARGMLEVIPAFQQHQGALTDQLQLLIPIANKLGLQDAADFISRSMKGDAG